MKHLKQKLMAATAMLMVSAVMLTTSTYAWFAISTTPDINEVTTTMVSYDSLEIKLGDSSAETAVGDSGTDTTWGNVIGDDTSTATSLLTSLSTLTLPAAYASTAITAGTNSVTTGVAVNSIYSVTYGDDGRISDYDTADAITYSGGLGAIKVSTTIEDTTTYETIGSAIQFQLRTNTEGDIKVSFSDVEESTGIVYKVYEVTEESTTSTMGIAANVTPSYGQITVATTTDSTTSAKTTTATDATIITSATANTVYMVELYVFYDGSTETNASFTEDGTSATKDVGFGQATFSNDEITDTDA